MSPKQFYNEIHISLERLLNFIDRHNMTNAIQRKNGFSNEFIVLMWHVIISSWFFVISHLMLWFENLWMQSGDKYRTFMGVKRMIRYFVKRVKWCLCFDPWRFVLICMSFINYHTSFSFSLIATSQFGIIDPFLRFTSILLSNFLVISFKFLSIIHYKKLAE